MNTYIVTFECEDGFTLAFSTRTTNVTKAVANAQKEYYRGGRRANYGGIVNVCCVEKFIRDDGHDTYVSMKVPSKKAVRKVHG